jgi:phosphoenolpyruvate carboxykinase (GTP)
VAGYGESSRVLEWIFRRCQGQADAVRTPIGLLPAIGADGINTDRLDISDAAMRQLLEVDTYGWR